MADATIVSPEQLLQNAFPLLRDDGAAYEAVSQSRLLSDLDIALLERCVAIRSWQQSRRAFRAGFGRSH